MLNLTRCSHEAIAAVGFTVDESECRAIHTMEAVPGAKDNFLTARFDAFFIMDTTIK